jgi:L-malate glycosyltransferase
MPAKILHLIGQMERGGAERQLLYLAQALRERGWEQVVLTLNPGEVWDGRLADIGISLLGIRRQRNKLLRLLQLALAVHSERPVLLHSWSNHTNVYASWLPGFGGLRRIFAFRNNPTVDRLGKSTMRVAHAKAYQSADCVVSNSQKALDCAMAAGVRAQRSEVVGNIVEARGRARPGERVKVPRVVAAGALIPIKGYDVLLEAFGQLAASGVAFALLLAGNGPERDRLEQQALSLGIGDRVEFLGGIDDVPALLSTAHIAVHSSRSEGLSNTILEAMAEGLPVVATSVGGTPEVILDGRSGFLVPPNDARSLAAKVKQLLDRSDLRIQLGQVGLEVVREKFNIDRIVTQYEHIYESVLTAEPTLRLATHNAS